MANTMWLQTMYSALLTLTVFIASSVSADETLADKILKREAECNFYIRQTDNAILDEGGDMFPMNPGQDYFKCVNSLDKLKRRYISDNLLGFYLDHETFPMQLSNETVLMMTAPAEEFSESRTKSPDFSHLEEMCIIHKTCSRISDDLLKSIADKKDSEANYFKVKRFYCMEILEKLKIKYIRENNMNMRLLKALGEIAVLCKEGRTSMSLPERLKDVGVSTSVTTGSTNHADSAPLKSSENNDLNSSKVPPNSASYNEIDVKVHKNKAAVSKSPNTEDSQTPSKEGTTLDHKEIPDSGKTGTESTKVDSNNDDVVPHETKKRVPDIFPVNIRIPVDPALLVPEVDNAIESNDDWKITSSQVLDADTKKSAVTYDELEETSFHMKAVAQDFNANSNSVAPPQVSVGGGENADAFENNGDNSFDEAKRDLDNNNDGNENSDANLKVDTDKSNTNDNGVKRVNDQAVDSNSEHNIEDDKVEKHDDEAKISDADINDNRDTFTDNGEDTNNSKKKIVSADDKVKIVDGDEKEITDKFVKTEKLFSTNDRVKTKDSRTNRNANDGENNDLKVSVDRPDVTTESTGSGNNERVDSTKTGIESGEVVSGARSGTESPSPGAMNGDSDHSGLPDSSLPDCLQLEEPRLDYSPRTTASPISDIPGDEVFKKEEDCKELIAVAKRLLKHGSVSYLDDEYTDCVYRLNQLKLLYIKQRGIDLEKYKTKFPVVLSTGAEELLSLPPLEGEPSTTHDSQTAVEDVLGDAKSHNDADGSDKKVHPPFNPILVSNEKFLEYFNRKVPSDEEKH